MPGKREIAAGAWALAASISLLAAGQPAQARERPVVIGYLAAFKDMKGTLASTNLDKLTHINLAFVNPGPDASIVTGDRMTCMDTANGADSGSAATQDVRDVVASAHAQRVKVLASLGGGQIPGCSGDWPTLLTPENRPRLIANLVEFADAFGLDGLDIDLEWDVLTAIDKAGNYVPFTAELGAALKARGKLLTCATASHEGGMVPVASLPYFDYVNLMSYDFIGPSWGTPGDQHATIDQAKADIAVWKARGLPKSKLVLGVPFYGYGFNGYNRGYDFKDVLVQFGPAAAETDLQGEACAGCKYVTYNGRETIRAKARLAREEGAGIMIWELSEDAPAPGSLLDVTDAALNGVAP